MKVLLGTTKGLLTLTEEGPNWRVQQVDFLGLPVSMIHSNKDNSKTWVALAIKHWGVKLHQSEDHGQTWKEIEAPKYPTSALVREGEPATLGLIWSMASSGDRQWIGTEPGGLFVSDQASGFQLVQSLWDHPSRPRHWFGGGRNHAGIHSICLHPQNPNRIYIGVSCAGVFHSDDGGTTWSPKNRGLRADYLPDPFVEVGHDPHRLELCRSHPHVLWQQNHCGVFRSTDGGEQWVDVTSKDEIGRYGFALTIDHENPDRAWIVPAESDECRVAKDLTLMVSRTEDGGKSWEHIRISDANDDCFDLTFRHAFDRHATSMVFGTTNGNLYVSKSDGDQWMRAHSNLPPIHVCKIIR
ncbi:MAG: hypothetical protein KTR24_09035 [Saprospiraceae bacterium]|nr:hypothetical protein [Saprospiraceae bacterium]